MFDNKQFSLDVREINEKEFKALSYGAYSHVGHTDVAEMTGLEFNKSPVHARIGDMILLTQIYREELKFYQIDVKK